ncbi:MAG: hypothetical protein H0W74_13785 [Sphingosinicella sp.]|nr:hypothetical protein [Sphingosinicella sp.]
MSAEQNVYAALSLVGDGLHLAVDQKAIAVRTPPARIVYGLFQGGLNATQATMFWVDHHNSKMTIGQKS